jgi:hypothetical protein
MTLVRRISGVSMVLLAGLFIISAACNQPAAPPVERPLPSDRVHPSPVGSAQTVLEKTFAVKGTVSFPFQVPAHAVRPHLHGIFESFLREVHGTSDDTANVDFLIVNQEQYEDLRSNRPSEALMSVEASHNQAVNYDLPASEDQPVKYYLVFRSSDAGKIGKVVEANFRVDY